MEAEGLGQRPAVGVTTFKKRNSEKRAGLVDDKLFLLFFAETLRNYQAKIFPLF